MPLKLTASLFKRLSRVQFTLMPALDKASTLNRLDTQSESQAQPIYRSYAKLVGQDGFPQEPDCSLYTSCLRPVRRGDCWAYRRMVSRWCQYREGEKKECYKVSRVISWMSATLYRE